MLLLLLLLQASSCLLGTPAVVTFARVRQRHSLLTSRQTNAPLTLFPSPAPQHIRARPRARAYTSTSSALGGRLGALRRAAAAAGAHRHRPPLVARVDALEHGRVFEHVGHHDEAHARAADVDVRELRVAPVAAGRGDVLELHVPVVLGQVQLAAVRLAALELDRHGVALGLVQQLDGDADALG